MYNITEIHNDPTVYIVDDFLSEDECNHIISISKSSLQRSLVSSNNGGIISEGRSSCNTWIEHSRDAITSRISNKICELVNKQSSNAENFQVIYYDEKQEYKPHYDGWEHDYTIQKNVNNLSKGGQRLLTALCYLNNVEEGGGTCFPKLNIEIEPKIGRLLVFENVYKNTNIKHDNSLHGGMPVIKGEKYAFNLWFREMPVNKIPSYISSYTNTNSDSKHLAIKNYKQHSNVETRINTNKPIYITNFISNNNISKLLKLSTFDNCILSNGWVNINKLDGLLLLLENTFSISKNFYENINVVKYNPLQSSTYYGSYDPKDEIQLEHMRKLGQRMYTITLILTDTIVVKYDNGHCYECNKGDVLCVRNTHPSTNIRNDKTRRTITNNSDEIGYIANIYVREFDANKNKFENSNITNKSILNKSISNNEDLNNSISVNEDYSKTLNDVYDLFNNNLVDNKWQKHNSFNYTLTGDFNEILTIVKKIHNIKINNNNTILNNTNFKTKHNVNKDPLYYKLENIIINDVHTILIDYYFTNMNLNTWTLGDRQSLRYKSHNEPISRFLHYELLPLIEHIVERRLKPTYTYLSIYVNGAELPEHTDRKECEYTVSLIIDKPPNTNWNIYLHKITQPEKYKGRYDITPNKEECIALDCDSNGLMIFQGTDHIHFRERLEHEYYSVVLLHYQSL